MPASSARKATRRVKKRTSTLKKRTSNRSSRRKRISKKTNKKWVKVVTVGALFLISVAVIFGVSFYNNLNKRFASADSVSSYDIRDRGIFSVLYIVVDSMSDDPLQVEEINMIFIDSNSKRLTAYKVPVDIETDVPGKFGIEPLHKVFALGALNAEDKFEGGFRLTRACVGRLFGYIPDKYILVDSTLKPKIDALFYEGSLSLDIGSFESDFTLGEFYYMYQLLNSLPSDRFNSSLFNPQLIDEELREFTFESDVALERKSIAILNGAAVPGVAAFGSRVIENMGGRVVYSGNADKIYNESMLVVEDPTSDTAKKIAHSFGFKSVIDKNEFSVSENEVNRSDIVLIFGLDRQGDL